MAHSGRVLLLSAAAFVVAAVWAGVPVAADTLVTTTGAQVQTKGPWKVKGNQVVFTQPDGKLSSLKVADVDLEKSAAATAKAAAPPAPPEAAKPAKPVVLRLTDNDVGHAESVDAPAADKPAATPEAVAAGASNALVVQGWDQHPGEDGSGILITGSVLNPTKNTATQITVDVGLYGADGKLLQVTRAALASESLPPGQKTSFRCAFPDVPAMTAAKFDIRSKPLVNAEQAPPEGTPPGGSS